MVIFNSYVTNYQRVNMFKIIPCISADSLWMNQWERVENRQSPGRAKKDGDSVGLKQQKLVGGFNHLEKY